MRLLLTIERARNRGSRAEFTTAAGSVGGAGCELACADANCRTPAARLGRTFVCGGDLRRQLPVASAGLVDRRCSRLQHIRYLSDSQAKCICEMSGIGDRMHRGNIVYPIAECGRSAGAGLLVKQR